MRSSNATISADHLPAISDTSSTSFFFSFSIGSDVDASATTGALGDAAEPADSAAVVSRSALIGPFSFAVAKNECCNRLSIVHGGFPGFTQKIIRSSSFTAGGTVAGISARAGGHDSSSGSGDAAWEALGFPAAAAMGPPFFCLLATAAAAAASSMILAASSKPFGVHGEPYAHSSASRLAGFNGRPTAISSRQQPNRSRSRLVIWSITVSVNGNTAGVSTWPSSGPSISVKRSNP